MIEKFRSYPVNWRSDLRDFILLLGTGVFFAFWWSF